MSALLRCGSLAACLLAVTTLSASAAAPAVHAAQIHWDEFGIPHIYGPDLLTVVRGLGYAQMENHAEALLTNVANARGRSAEYFGAGTANANVTNDILVRTEGIPARAARWLKQGGQQQQQILQAYADGANEYAQRHGDTIAARFHQVLPVVPTDVTAGIQNTIHFTFMPEQDNLPALITAWQQGGIAAANALARSFTPEGSNGWALGPGKSADGNAILMGNPHLPWGNNAPIPGLSLYQWMETNLIIGDPQNPSLNATGVCFLGAPFIGIGYSDYVGWTHTNNTIQNTNLYQLTLNPNGTYNFGGGTQPLAVSSDTIKILKPGGGYLTKTFPIYASVHGPVIAQNGNKALAFRVAGLDTASTTLQYWGMIQAHSLQDFIKANSALQMPFFNVIYADRDGHIMYLFGGRQPVRNGGTWGDYDGILNGASPGLVWTDTLRWHQLPQAIDPPGGFVANSNNPPWTSSFPQTATNDPAKFPAYVAPQFMDFRPQNAANFLLSQQSFTADELLAGKMSVHMLLADRVAPALVAAAETSSDPTARAAAKVLKAWTHEAAAGSRGAVLFERWWQIVATDPKIAKDTTDNFYSPHPKFRVGWSPSDPLNTPTGLADAAATIPDLILAAQQVQALYGALDVAWGDVHRTVLVSHDAKYQAVTPVADTPLSGPNDEYGPVRVVNPFPAPDGTHDLWSYGGDGYVQLVEFTQGGAQAKALLTYGNSSRPGSPHITDQLPYFNALTLRAVYRTYQDVTAHTKRIEFY
jgi:acyl-homoserine-lactone acylase